MCGRSSSLGTQAYDAGNSRSCLSLTEASTTPSSARRRSTRRSRSGLCPFRHSTPPRMRSRTRTGAEPPGRKHAHAPEHATASSPAPSIQKIRERYCLLVQLIHRLPRKDFPEKMCMSSPGLGLVFEGFVERSLRDCELQSPRCHIFLNILFYFLFSFHYLQKAGANLSTPYLSPFSQLGALCSW